MLGKLKANHFIDGITYEPNSSGNVYYGTYLDEGKPQGTIYGLQREGVYASSEGAYAQDREGNIYYLNGEPLKMMYNYLYFIGGGDTKYKDLNYDGMIDAADLIGSFLRMDYLNLGYKFGSTFCQKIHVKDLALNLSGQRLYTYSKYSGMNPETGISTNRLNVDQSFITAPEVYTLSISLSI
ncbi:MAG: hypothetical protein ACM3O8_13975 [Methylococcaceae bacterium]